jgi:histidine triad (HIT) family protein
MRDGCPFCEYAGPNPILRAESGIFIIEPLRPVAPGHVLVIPKTHVTDFSSRIDITGRVFEVAARWCKQNCRCDECESRPGHRGDANLITSKGGAATQTVGHFHVHVVPRRAGDKLALPWSSPDLGPLDGALVDFDHHGDYEGVVAAAGQLVRGWT